MQDTNDVCDTLLACMGTGGGNIPILKDDIKIRKLTPKECWRLMGFDDKDFEKAKAIPISNTQLYKQARKQYSRKCITKNIYKFINRGVRLCQRKKWEKI